MRFLFIEISNYIIAVNMAVYAILSLAIFGAKNSKGKSVISAFQNVCNILILVTAFAHLFICTKDFAYLFIFAGVLFSVIILLSVTSMVYPDCDRLLLNNIAMLFSAGMIMISRISTHRSLRQLIIFNIVLFICIFIPFILIKIDFWKKITWVYAGVGLFSIAAVLIAGNLTHGSKITITVLGLTFQPSEAVKVMFIFFLAALLWKDINLKKLIFSAVTAAAFILILVMSKDLGSALIFVIVYILMVYIATGKWIYLIGGAIVSSAASVVAYYLFSHVRVRVNIWLDPWSDIDNKGYQIAQSLFSISGGGLFGTGLTKGSPKSIPFCETDFIFSSITEELGILFSIGILLVCISSFIEMIRLASKIHDMFYRLIVYGIAVTLIFQTFLTVGGGIKFIPLTGVTLPLVSYGGTSILVSMFMYYIVQGVYIKLRRTDTSALYKFHGDAKVGKQK